MDAPSQAGSPVRYTARSGWGGVGLGARREDTELTRNHPAARASESPVTEATMNVRPEDAMASPTPTRAPRSGAGRLVALGLVVVGVVAALKLLPVNQWLLAFVGWIRDAGATGMAVFVLAYVVACILLLPGLILALGAGFAYGVAVGIPLVWVSANLGAAAAFLLGRTLARDRIAARVAGNPKFAAIDRAVGREGLKIVLLTRLSPAFPFNLLNYAYGLTRVTFRDYTIGSLVGMIPGTAMYVYLGSLITSVTELASGAPSGGTAKQALTFLGFAATVAVTVVIARIARHALDQATTARRASPETAPAATPARAADEPLVLPEDEHNRKPLSPVHPTP